MSHSGIHRHLPTDLTDTDVVRVRVVAPHAVFVVHRDRTYASHRFEPEDFHGDYISLREPEVFATAQALDGTLAWDLGGGLVYDVAPDALWLHAHGWCDGSHDLSQVVRGTSLRDGIIGLEWVEPDSPPE